MPYLTLDPVTKRFRRDIYSEVAGELFDEDYELDALTGFSFRKAIKKIGRGIKKIHRKNPLVKLHKKIRKKIKPYIRKLAPIVLPIAGAILAPFTGGASVLAAGLLTQGMKMYEQRKAVKKMERQDKRVAAAMAADEARESKRLEAAADKLYRENTQTFIQSGYPPDKWKTYNVDQKLAVIDRINRATQQGATRPVSVNQRPVTTTGPKPTIQQVPVNQRGAATGRMGDPARALPVERVGCPSGFSPVALSDYMESEMKIPTSVNGGGAGGFLTSSYTLGGGWIIGGHTPTQKLYMDKRSWASGLRPPRKVTGIKATRRARGLWKMHRDSRQRGLDTHLKKNLAWMKGKVGDDEAQFKVKRRPFPAAKRTGDVVGLDGPIRYRYAPKKIYAPAADIYGGSQGVEPWVGRSKYGVSYGHVSPSPYVLGLGQDEDTLGLAAIEAIRLMDKEIAAAKKALREMSVSWTDAAASALRIYLATISLGTAQGLLGTRAGKALAALASSRRLLSLTRDMLKRKWFAPKLYEQLDKTDPDLSKRVGRKFDEFIRVLVQVTDAEAKWKRLPDRVVDQFARDFYSELFIQTKKLSAVLDGALEAAGKVAAAVGEFPLLALGAVGLVAALVLLK